ncbi:hypothetical protein AURDEDRAFT_140687 [Auricularia subglabra TFB-10046 SS5]|uniref:DNA-directed DNA polymerase n=1 Tax=Auricularia subglabra (strain TFB-10046 / SS5) TaxID=717982 RepID=J0CQP5_AURST|nr:hypothetical protein AURDEDRAFT_140687 [Auricularia subglabra TFB-10046 SS5]
MNEKGIKKVITKLILNSAFGRFGMSIFKPVTELVDNIKFQKILITHRVLDFDQLNDNLFMVTYESQISTDLVKKGGKLYYSDTDSIVTDIDLPDELIGKELGKFKVEYKIKKAIFITGKTYYLLLDNGEIVIKAKGVNSRSLTPEDFEDIYKKRTKIYNKEGV